MNCIHFFACICMMFCCMWSTSRVVAQEQNPKNELQLQYGLRQYARQDLLFSPMVYRGNSLSNIQLTYKRQDDKTSHQLTLGLGLYQATAHPAYQYLEWRTLEEAQTSPTTFVLLDFHYSLLRTVYQGNKVKMVAGGMLENQLGAFFYGYGSQSFFGYTLMTGLSPAWQIHYKMHPHHLLEAGMSIPVVSWVARSPYAVNDDEFIENQSVHRVLPMLGRFYSDGRLVSLDQLQKLNWQLTYQYALSHHWAASVAYQGEYFRLTFPRQSVAIRHELALGISYLF